MRPLLGCSVLTVGIILVFAIGFLFPTFQPVITLQQTVFCHNGERLVPTYREINDSEPGDAFTYDYFCVGDGKRDVNAQVYISEIATVGVLIILGVVLLISGNRRSTIIPTLPYSASQLN